MLTIIIQIENPTLAEWFEFVGRYGYLPQL